MRHSIFCLLLLSISLFAHAQIVNIESLRMENDTSCFAGRENFSFQLTQTNVQLSRFSNNLALQFRSSEHLLLFLSNVDFTFSDATDFERSGFFHLRYNYRQSEYLTYEAFTQYQVDFPLRIQNRFLNGLGTRINLMPGKQSKLQWGTLIMYEHDDELENDITHNDFRLSTYLSVLLKAKRSPVFSAVIYYQPRLDVWADFRLSGQAQLSFKIWKKLKFMVNASVNYDSSPVQDPNIPMLTYKIANGISFEF